MRERQGRRGDGLYFEHLERQTHTADVHERVHSAQLVEVDVVHLDAVHRRLRLPNDAKDPEGAVARPVGQAGARDPVEALGVREGRAVIVMVLVNAMAVLVPAVVRVLVSVAVVVRMPAVAVFVRVRVVVRVLVVVVT